jgi:hypothetical protein
MWNSELEGKGVVSLLIKFNLQTAYSRKEINSAEWEMAR